MLENLEPSVVWKHFEKICSIPHPSGAEEKIANYVIDLAAKNNLSTIKDSAGNVLVRKNSTNIEKKDAVVLQSHLDMVPQKNSEVVHNFLTDPILPYIDGQWLKAKATTLGADNGIGVAIVCAILESKEIKHGPIEALFTVDEERGMSGAFGLSKDILKGKMLINLDTENEDEICIGCAGGRDIVATFRILSEQTPKNCVAYNLKILGLKGGHSGIDIHLNRGNALKLISTLLKELYDCCELKVSSLNGGSARNAIPREAFATVCVPVDRVENFKITVDNYKKRMLKKYKEIDPDFNITITETTLPEKILSKESFEVTLLAMIECPNGVLEMDKNFENVVETSNNLSIVSLKEDIFRIECMLRSSSTESLVSYYNSISDIFAKYQAKIADGNIFPPWQPKTNSRLLEIMKKAYTDLYKKELKVVVVHAGLECGIIGSKYPEMEMVSCGPTIRFPHSPDERLHIASVNRFWKWLIKSLEQL